MHFDRYNIDRRALEEAVCVHAAGHANRLQSFRVHNLSPWDSRIRFGAYDLGEGLRGSYLTPPPHTYDCNARSRAIEFYTVMFWRSIIRRLVFSLSNFNGSGSQFSGDNREHGCGVRRMKFYWPTTEGS